MLLQDTVNSRGAKKAQSMCTTIKYGVFTSNFLLTKIIIKKSHSLYLPNVLVTRAVKSTSCSGRPVAQSNNLRTGSSLQDVQTPLPPEHRKRTCCSLRSDTENVCCKVRRWVMMVKSQTVWQQDTTHVDSTFWILTSTFWLSWLTTWTRFQYPTHKRPLFARQQRMGCKGVDPRATTLCDCRSQPPVSHSTH